MILFVNGMCLCNDLYVWRRSATELSVIINEAYNFKWRGSQ